MDVLLRGLGISGDEIPTEIPARASMLRSLLAGRRLLIMLDDALSAEQVRPLLPGTPGPMTLITSRSQLRGLVIREGARRIGLDQLDPAESTTLLETALRPEQVSHQPASLLELADRCGYLPLALAIAAERANRHPELGLGELIGELRTERERLDALDAGDDSIDLRAVFAWSYHALDDETARMFRLLGLYPGPDFGIPAAAMLADATPARTRRILDRLEDGNLVQRRRGGRYQLHDLMREYAAELAERDAPSDRAAALGRLFEWFAHSAANARSVTTIRPPLVEVGEPTAAVTPSRFDDREQADEWFDTERPNVQAAARLAAKCELHQAVYRLVLTSWGHLLRRRAFDDMLELLSLASEATRHLGDITAQAMVAYQLGTTYGEMHRSEQAIGPLRDAIALFERAGHDRGHERALNNLGVAFNLLGRSDDAADCFERVIDFGRRVGDDRIMVSPMFNLATAFNKQSRYDEAAELCVEALEICRDRSMGPVATGMATLTLGEARAGQGHTDEAIDLFGDAINLFRLADDHWYLGSTMTVLGRTYQDIGRLDDARRVWQQALDLFDELGAPDGATFSRSELVGLLADLDTSARKR